MSFIDQCVQFVRNLLNPSAPKPEPSPQPVTNPADPNFGVWAYANGVLEHYQTTRFDFYWSVEELAVSSFGYYDLTVKQVVAFIPSASGEVPAEVVSALYETFGQDTRIFVATELGSYPVEVEPPVVVPPLTPPPAVEPLPVMRPIDDVSPEMVMPHDVLVPPSLDELPPSLSIPSMLALSSILAAEAAAVSSPTAKAKRSAKSKRVCVPVPPPSKKGSTKPASRSPKPKPKSKPKGKGKKG
jgi:hypothetical protein